MAFGSSANAGSVEVDVEGNFSKFEGDLKSKGNAAGGKFGSSFGQGFGSKVATLGAAYLGANFAKDVINASSDAAEAVNVTGLAFGSARGEIDKTAESAADMFGITETAYRGLSAQIGNIFVQSGTAQDEAAKLTNNLIGRATDMGSAWNASTQEVSESINSALIGSYEPLRKYGVILDKATVREYALANGMADASGEVSAQAEQLATAALIMEQTANVAGDFANTQDGLANSTKTLGAMWGDMQADLGMALLPVLEMVVGMMRELGPEGLKMVVVGGAIAIAFVKVVQASQALGGALTVLSASPFILAALAIVAVGVLIWKNWDEISAKLGAAWEWFAEVSTRVADDIEATWRSFTAGVSDVFDTLGQFFVDWWPFLLGVFTGGLGLIVGLVVQNWDAIYAKTIELVTGIVGQFANAWNTVYGTVSSIGGAVVGFIVGIPNRISSAFTTLAETITAPFRTSFNAIKVLWNSTVGGFGFTTPSWIPSVGGKSFTIPSMATGGLAANPMLAMVGDAGPGDPEVVSPVSMMRDTFLDALATGGQNSTPATGAITVNVTMRVDAGVTDPAFFERQATEITRTIARELDRERKAQGLPSTTGAFS